MHDFFYKNGEYFCEDVAVSAIAKKVGTPVYIYSHKTLTEHLFKIQKAFAEINPLICFAMKSNDNVAVVKSLVNHGAGCDIVSGGELKKALKVGTDPKKIVFASVGKTEEEIAAALKAGILFFNVESLPELEEINRIAQQMHKRAPVALRINPDVDAATHEAITTGTLKNKFGIDLTSTRDILKSQKKYSHIKIKGLHIHIGSQIVSKDPFIKAISKASDFVHDLRAEGIELEYFDIGGGLGIIYKDENPQTPKDFAGAVLPYLKKLGLKIVMEPGRFIAGNAGILVARILYLKDNGVKKFLIVDAGMNDLIRPSLYGAYHEIIPVIEPAKHAGHTLMDVVGPICESGDFLGKDRMLPELNKGDLVAVLSAGAYGYVMASNYNVRSKPVEVMVKGKQFEVIKERETFKDLTRGESIPKFL